MNGLHDDRAAGPPHRPGTALFILPAAALAGPHGLGLVSASVVGYFDPAVPVALAALGVLVGFAIPVREWSERWNRSLAGTITSDGLTMLIVGIGVAVVCRLLQLSFDIALWLIAAALGICASSASTVVDDVDRIDRAGQTLLELDNVLPIVAGGLALAYLRQGHVGAALSVTAQAIAISLIIATVAWLLIAYSSSEREQQVFAMASLLLLGGSAEYLSLSALLAGLVAGMFWQGIGGPARDRIYREVHRLQRPLVLFVFLMAGVHAETSVAWLGVAMLYLVLRVGGRLVAAAAARRVERVDRRRFRAAIAPGIIGLAFAVNVFRAGGAEAAPILAIAVAGTFGAELLAAMAGGDEGK